MNEESFSQTEAVWREASRFRHDWKGKEEELFARVREAKGLVEKEPTKTPQVSSKAEAEEWAKSYLIDKLIPKEIAKLPKAPFEGKIDFEGDVSPQFREKLLKIQVPVADEYTEALIYRLFGGDPRQAPFKKEGQSKGFDRKKFIRAYQRLGSLFSDENWRILVNWKYPCEPQMENKECHGLERMGGDKPLEVLGLVGQNPSATERKNAWDKYRQRLNRLGLRSSATKKVPKAPKL